MTTLEIKSDILKRINSLNKNKLNEINGYLENLEHKDIELIDWINLSKEQQNRIDDSIAQLNSGKVSSHKNLIKEVRNKITND